MAIIDATFFSEKYDVRDFIMVRNPELREVAGKLKGRMKRQSALNVVKFVARNFEYPFDWKARPTTARYVKVFRFWNGFYLYENFTDYAWLFPNQLLHVRKGICIDTSNLATTLHRILGVPSFTVLGGIWKKTRRKKKFLGLHAWNMFSFSGKWFVFETTVHPREEWFPLEQAVSGELGIIYDEIARFDEKTYVERKEKIEEYGEFL